MRTCRYVIVALGMALAGSGAWADPPDELVDAVTRCHSGIGSVDGVAQAFSGTGWTESGGKLVSASGKVTVENMISDCGIFFEGADRKDQFAASLAAAGYARQTGTVAADRLERYGNTLWCAAGGSTQAVIYASKLAVTRDRGNACK